MLAGAFAGIAVSRRARQFVLQSLLNDMQEHSVMYPVDLLKVTAKNIYWRLQSISQRF